MTNRENLVRNGFSVTKPNEPMTRLQRISTPRPTRHHRTESSLPPRNARPRVMALMLTLACLSGLANPPLCRAAEAQNPGKTATWIGSNYTPAYAANQVQLWHEFKPEIIAQELAAAHRHFGINSLRVYLHYINFRDDRENFLRNLGTFIGLCDRAGIKPGFVFFDDCWNHKDVSLKTEAAVPGRHNGRWAAVQDVDRKDENLPFFEAYVSTIVKQYANDPRIHWWEIYNEPNRSDRFTELLCQKGFAWTKAQKPTQPVICSWDDNPQTEIVDAHNYSNDFSVGGAWDRQADANPAKGCVLTEAGARWHAGQPASNGSPIEVMHWLNRRKSKGQSLPGVYLCWELMVGNSNCRWYWGTPDGTMEPPIPWCGLLFPDGTPVSYAEAEAVRSYATGKPQAMLFQNFQDCAPVVVPPDPAGWQRFAGAPGGSSSRWCALAANEKIVAGDPNWKDYVVETTVMLRDDVNQGNVGICFRVSKPGPGPDEMTGYFAGFNGSKLYVGRMENNWLELANVDLTNQPNKITKGSWNLLRVAIKGDRIQVWLNPSVGRTGPLVDVRDTKAPIPQGGIALRTNNAPASFDDVVVLPISVIEDKPPKTKP